MNDVNNFRALSVHTHPAHIHLLLPIPGPSASLSLANPCYIMVKHHQQHPLLHPIDSALTRSLSLTPNLAIASGGFSCRRICTIVQQYFNYDIDSLRVDMLLGVSIVRANNTMVDLV